MQSFTARCQVSWHRFRLSTATWVLVFSLSSLSGKAQTSSPAAPVAGANQAEVAQAFASASVRVAEAIGRDVFARFRVGKQAHLIAGEKSLTVQATGDDPQILLPPFAAGRRFIIKTVIASPADTTMQAYYLRQGQAEYSEEQSQTAPLKRGRNEVYFRFDDAAIIDPIRIDVGTISGEYIIESMVARSAPAR